MNIKPGDLIFLVKDETAMRCEHIIKVEEYDNKSNIVKSSKVYTIHKMLLQDGSMNYGLAPGFFIISNNVENKSLNTNTNDSIYWINLNNFDVVGPVINNDIIKAFKEQESNLIIPDINTTKGILGKNV